MKSFLIFISLFMFVFFHAQINQAKTWKDFALQGKVKFVEENIVTKKKKNNETYTLEFNTEGNILKKEEKYKDKKVTTLLSYDAQKRLEIISFQIFIKKKLVLESIMTLKYNNDSIFVSTNITDHGKKTNKTFTAISKNGLHIKYFGEKKGESRVTEFVYDNYNNMISQISYKNGEISHTYEQKYEYDANGNILKKISGDQGSTIEYLPNGLTKSYDDFTFAYTYDTTGNWIRKIKLEKGKKSNESIRKIIYFDEYSQ